MRKYPHKPFLRLLSGILGLSIPLLGASTAILVSSLEPQQSINFKIFTLLISLGLLLGIGLILFAITPRPLLYLNKIIRYSCVALLLIPIIPAIYFINVTGSSFVAGYCLLLLIVVGADLFYLAKIQNNLNQQQKSVKTGFSN